MAWKTLSDYYKQNFEKNRAFLWQRYPHLFHSLGDLQEVLPFIQIMERDGSIRAIQIRQDNRTRMILPPDYSPELLDQQRQSIQEAFQNKHRLIILSGIGAGHSLISLSERLRAYAHSAALVCEPRVENWTAFLALFPAQEILQSPRLYLFGGSEAAEQLTHFTRRNTSTCSVFSRLPISRVPSRQRRRRQRHISPGKSHRQRAAAVMYAI